MCKNRGSKQLFSWFCSFFSTNVLICTEFSEVLWGAFAVSTGSPEHKPGLQRGCGCPCAAQCGARLWGDVQQ